MQADETKSPEKERVWRRLKYLLLSWSIQLFCALLCFVLVLWGTIQLLRIFNLIGVGGMPPGLEHAPAT